MIIQIIFTTSVILDIIFTVVSVYWLGKLIHSFTKSVFLYFIQLNWIQTSQIFNFFCNICEVCIQLNSIKYKNTDFVNEWIHLRSQYTLTTVILQPQWLYTVYYNYASSIIVQILYYNAIILHIIQKHTFYIILVQFTFLSLMNRNTRLL